MKSGCVTAKKRDDQNPSSMPAESCDERVFDETIVSRYFGGMAGVRRGGGEPARDRDWPALAQWRGGRAWIILTGALLMALAGVLAGALMGLDDLAYPALRGPRLRVAPSAALTPASLSREPPPKPGGG
jgi:hypothetical protein